MPKPSKTRHVKIPPDGGVVFTHPQSKVKLPTQRGAFSPRPEQPGPVTPKLAPLGDLIAPGPHVKHTRKGSR